MSVAVLNPQDYLKVNRFSKQPLIPSPEMKYPKKSNPNFNRSNRMLSNRRKRSPPRHQILSPPSRALEAPKVPVKNNLVMGQVKILKRGEELSTATKKAPEPQKKTTDRAPEPQKMTIDQAPEPQKKRIDQAPEPQKKTIDQALEPQKKTIEKRDDPDLGSTERLGPGPESVPIQIRLTESKNRVAAFYAGSAFITSPPPSSLPLPAFFTKKSVTVKNDDATSDLRRILKLDMFVK